MTSPNPQPASQHRLGQFVSQGCLKSLRTPEGSRDCSRFFLVGSPGAELFSNLPENIQLVLAAAKRKVQIVIELACEGDQTGTLELIYNEIIVAGPKPSVSLLIGGRDPLEHSPLRKIERLAEKCHEIKQRTRSELKLKLINCGMMPEFRDHLITTDQYFRLMQSSPHSIPDLEQALLRSMRERIEALALYTLKARAHYQKTLAEIEAESPAQTLTLAIIPSRYLSLLHNNQAQPHCYLPAVFARAGLDFLPVEAERIWETDVFGRKTNKLLYGTDGADRFLTDNDCRSAIYGEIIEHSLKDILSHLMSENRPPSCKLFESNEFCNLVASAVIHGFSEDLHRTVLKALCSRPYLQEGSTIQRMLAERMCVGLFKMLYEVNIYEKNGAALCFWLNTLLNDFTKLVGYKNTGFNV